MHAFVLLSLHLTKIETFMVAICEVDLAKYIDILNIQNIYRLHRIEVYVYVNTANVFSLIEEFLSRSSKSMQLISTAVDDVAAVWHRVTAT